MDLIEGFSYFIIMIMTSLLFSYLFIIKLVIVNEGEAIIIERLGKFNKILYSGFHIYYPIIDKQRYVNWTYVVEDSKKNSKTIHKGDSRIPFNKKITFDPESVKTLTKDRILVDINIIIIYEIIDVKKAVYNIEDLYHSFQVAILPAIRNCVVNITLDELLSDKNNILTYLKSKLSEVSSSWGINVINIELQSINIPNSFLEATEKIISKERESLLNKKTELAKRDLELYEKETKYLLLEKQNLIEKLITESKIKCEELSILSKAETESKVLKIKTDTEKQRLNILFNHNEKNIKDYLFLKTYTESFINTKTVIASHDYPKILSQLSITDS